MSDSILIPKNEQLWTTYRDESGNVRFFVTSTALRDSYIMYQTEEGMPKKLGRASTPTELENKYSIWEKLRERPLPKEEKHDIIKEKQRKQRSKA